MTKINRKFKSTIAVITAVFMVVVSSFAFSSYADDEQSPVVIKVKGDTEYALKASELSKSGSSGAKRGGKTAADGRTRLLIVYNSEFDCSGLEGLNRAVFGDNGMCVMQFDSAEDAEAAYDELQGWDQVKSVEFDQIVKADGITGDKKFKSQGSGHLSWGANYIDADRYVNYVNSSCRRRVVVAVVDTGVDASHYWLSSRVLSNGYDFVWYDDDPDDEDGHGTHVAGIITDCTLGMDDVVKIMPVRVLDENGEGWMSDIADGILYAADNGASVINLSLGGPDSDYVDSAVNSAISKKAVVVCAAGNEYKNIDADGGTCPAHIENAVTVGAINNRGTYAYFSNYGKKLDVMAPGVAIYSSIPGNDFDSWDGTSMAAPHVSACAALLKMRYPNKNCMQISSVLKRSANAKSPTNRYGKGIVDMGNLIAPISSQKVAVTASFTYNGKALRPTLLVARNGEKLFLNDDYSVTYANNVNVGKATATVHGKGSYSGTKTVSFKIVPKGTKIKSLKKGKRKCTVKWNKQTTQTSGYQIQYSTSKKFKGSKKKLVSGKSKTSCKLTNLKSGKKYYFRIRTYKTVNGKKYYSSWSKKKSVKIK